MAKRTSKSRKSPVPSSASSTNKPMDNGKLVLRTRSTQKMKQTAIEKTKPKSAKKPKKAADKIDSNKPKKPPTAFFFYLEDFRKDFQEQNPDVKSMRHIGKACGEKWKTMTYEEKVHYYDVATEKRADFDRAMVDYIRRKESGEEIKYEDSECDE